MYPGSGKLVAGIVVIDVDDRVEEDADVGGVKEVAASHLVRNGVCRCSTEEDRDVGCDKPLLRSKGHKHSSLLHPT